MEAVLMKRIRLRGSGSFYKIYYILCAELSGTNCRNELSCAELSGNHWPMVINSHRSQYQDIHVLYIYLNSGDIGRYGYLIKSCN